MRVCVCPHLVGGHGAREAHIGAEGQVLAEQLQPELLDHHRHAAPRERHAGAEGHLEHLLLARPGYTTTTTRRSSTTIRRRTARTARNSHSQSLKACLPAACLPADLLPEPPQAGRHAASEGGRASLPAYLPTRVVSDGDALDVELITATLLQQQQQHMGDHHGVSMTPAPADERMRMMAA